MDKHKKILHMIAEDCEADSKNFAGQPFTGRVVGEYLGGMGAQIAAIANIVRDVIEHYEGHYHEDSSEVVDGVREHTKLLFTGWEHGRQPAITPTTHSDESEDK